MANTKRKESLLDKAKKVKTYNKSSKTPTEEEIEVAVAWAKEQLTTSQVMSVFNCSKGGYVYFKLAKCLKFYITANNEK